MADPALVVSRRIHAERLILLGWSRAILLQIAHPLVGAGVGTHSSFRDGHRATARRLHRTIRAMLDLTFGDDVTRARAVRAIRVIHDRVNGTLPESVGPFPAGTPYSANDPALLLWVHATVLESVVIAFEAFVGPLEVAERDAYCAESAPVAIALGALSSDVPRTWQALTAYTAAVEDSGVLVVSAEARDIAEAVLSPPMAAAIWPAVWLNREFTLAHLSPDIRQQFGLVSRTRSARLDRVTRTVRRIRRSLPRRLACWTP